MNGCAGRLTMLVAMAGAPGTGKSTIAACLEERLGAVVLNKDRVRAALFAARVQDDIAIEAIYRVAQAILKNHPQEVVIIDGRTFLRAGQVRDLLSLAATLGKQPHIIECVCDDAVAKERLERDLMEGPHPARNRTYDLSEREGNRRPD